MTASFYSLTSVLNKINLKNSLLCSPSFVADHSQSEGLWQCRQVQSALDCRDEPGDCQYHDHLYPLFHNWKKAQGWLPGRYSLLAIDAQRIQGIAIGSSGSGGCHPESAYTALSGQTATSHGTTAGWVREAGGWAKTKQTEDGGGE